MKTEKLHFELNCSSELKTELKKVENALSRFLLVQFTRSGEVLQKVI